MKLNQLVNTALNAQVTYLIFSISPLMKCYRIY